MSAIAALLRPQPAAQAQRSLGGMLAAMHGRCRDGAAVWASEGVGLGHGALHTTPEDAGAGQPLENGAAGLVVAADARIDNRDELIRALGRAHRLTHASPDAALILAAYAEWGEACPERLLGDFAFVVWDAPRRRLFCARDHLGIRPFYYHHRRGFFVAASEIKGLHALPEVPRAVSALRVADFITRESFDAETSFYEGVLRLPPAHSLTLGAEGAPRLRRYWAFDGASELRLDSDRAYEEAFLEHFTEAVRCRLRAAAPVGVMVSGGLDSSSVACVARDLLGARARLPLSTFTATFPGLTGEDRRRADESEYQQALDAQGGFRMHYVPLSDLSPLAYTPHVLGALDQPGFMGNPYLTCAAFEAAEGQGIGVMLDGCEGDSAVSHGYGRLGELTMAGAWPTLQYELQQLAVRNGSDERRLFLRYAAPLAARRAARNPLGFALRDAAALGRILGEPAARILWRESLKPALRRLRGGAASAAEAVWPGFRILNPDLLESSGYQERYDAHRRQYLAADFTERNVHWANLHLGAGLVSVVEEEVNSLASAAGLEVRHPFYDIRLMSFCLSLPADQKLRDGWTRSILRRSMAGILPPTIQWRPGKGDLSPDSAAKLFTMEADRIGALFAEDADLLAPYFDMKRLRAAVEARDYMKTSVALTLAAWLRAVQAAAGEAQPAAGAERSATVSSPIIHSSHIAMKNTYQAPTLAPYGPIEALTGTWPPRNGGNCSPGDNIDLGLIKDKNLSFNYDSRYFFACTDLGRPNDPTGQIS